MISLRASFGHALAVMNMLLCSEELSHHPVSVWFEAYQNGREHGVLIWGGGDMPAYYVADHRNSDHLRVHKGKYSMQGVSDDAYQHQHEFKTVEECVRWLELDLLQVMAEEQFSRDKLAIG